jgi:hypothetical protein
MKKLLTAMTAVSALTVAAPALAQTGYGNGNGNYNNGYGNGYNPNANGAVGIDNRLARLEARIQAGVQSGDIDQREAWRLRQQLRDITRLDRQYGRDGYTQQERADMQMRLRSFRDQLSAADGRGYGNGNGQYGSNGYNNNGYGNNGYNNNNGYNSRDGAYEEAYCDDDSRGGIGGLIDSIFGGGGGGGNCGGNGGSWGVGARASSSWGAVPYQYRNQYRDSGNLYYRSDGRTIYGIDARNNTVVRVYPMNR